MTGHNLDYSRYFWQGDKVRLRPLSVDDAEHAFASSLDSPSRQLLQLGIELPTSVEELRTSLLKWVGCKEADGAVVFMVDDLKGETVGGISLHSRDRKNGIFSFGVVTDREHQGKGYAEDAVRVLLRYGFWERRFQKCNSACVATNEGSIRLHEKLGFSHEGRVRRRWFLNGEYCDDVLFGLTREEFDAGEKA